MTLVLLILAIVAFGFAAVGEGPKRVKLVPLGLALFAASFLPL